MKFLVPAALLSLFSAWQPARADTSIACNEADPTQVRLRVSVAGMRSDEGNITITIYPDDAAHFLDGKYKLARQSVPVKLPLTRACFAVAAPGFYAVALFHDENNNHHLDTNFLGIPTEGYGFSQNPKLFLGPPKLSQVRIAAHPGDNPVAIRMAYY
ncbi:MAG: DUF2141 domain-containing protein [Proteobacteria bacterium]|nr:DUF2141 domain-containing protein [Pseudomonadota bacterium]